MRKAGCRKTWANGWGVQDRFAPRETRGSPREKTADTGAKQGDEEWPGQGGSTRRGQLSGRVIARRSRGDGHRDCGSESRGTNCFVGGASPALKYHAPLAVAAVQDGLPIRAVSPGQCSNSWTIKSGAPCRSTSPHVDLIRAGEPFPGPPAPSDHEGRQRGTDGSEPGVWRRKSASPMWNVMAPRPNSLRPRWLDCPLIILTPMIGVSG